MEYIVHTVEKSPYSGISYPTPQEITFLLPPDGLVYASGNEGQEKTFFYLVGERDYLAAIDPEQPQMSKTLYKPIDGVDIYVTGIRVGQQDVTFRAYILRGPSKFSYVKYALETPLTVYYEVDSGGSVVENWSKREYTEGELTPAIMKRELKALYEDHVGGAWPKEFAHKFKRMRR